ncbi:unnamed protein product [Caenorhabditis auriculariae]|uniref:Glucosamine 6-phosphate N-acetyltransferase n=1 Tax=Caenorhabditis auriculariae TaxID=2777116 RepID=A0A8S1GN66_9PELO|nr:unnamed protein product [Caenorhabditis auriculariae]
MNGMKDEMFDSSLISRFQKEIEPGYVLRPLQMNDHQNGYLDLLSQLTSVGDVDDEWFEKRFISMRDTNPKAYYVVVLADEKNDRIVASATLVIEWKFIHQAGCRGRVEDVVVDEQLRGKKIGSLLNRILVHLAQQIGVYKLSLECKDKLIPFYESFGYKKDEGNNFLVQRFDH